MLVGSVITLHRPLAFTLLGGTVWGLLAGQRPPRHRPPVLCRGTTSTGRQPHLQAPLRHRVRPLHVRGLSRTSHRSRSDHHLRRPKRDPRHPHHLHWAIALGAVLIVTSLLLPSGPHPESTQSAARPGPSASSCADAACSEHSRSAASSWPPSTSAWSTFPSLGTERGIAAGTIGILLTVRAVASMTSRLFLGRLSAWLGRTRLLTASIAASAVGMALLPVPDADSGCYCFSSPAPGSASAPGSPSPCPGSRSPLPPGLRGRAMSLRLTGNRLGQVVVPSAAGVLAVGAGAEASYGSPPQPWPPSVSQPATSPAHPPQPPPEGHPTRGTNHVRPRDRPRPSPTAQLAPTGTLRAVINLGNPVLAQGTAAEPRGVTVAIARELARWLGVPLQLECVDAARKSYAAITEGRVDLCFLATSRPARRAWPSPRPTS